MSASSIRDHVSVGDLHRARHHPERFMRKGIGSAIAGAVRDFKTGWNAMGPAKPKPKTQTPVSVTGPTTAPSSTAGVKVNARAAAPGGFACPKHGNYTTHGEHRVDNPTCRFGPRVPKQHVAGTPVAVNPPAAKTVVKVGKKVAP